MIKTTGQEKLLEQLNKYTLATLPKTLLFLGDKGCGKHTFIRNLCERLSLDKVHVNLNTKGSKDKSLKDTIRKQIQEFILSTTYKAYVIDLAELENKDPSYQEIFLKFIEEPGEFAYIMLIADSEMGILPTILNRCVKCKFAPYTKDELLQATGRTINNDVILEICKTPGQLEEIDTLTFDSLLDLCNKIIQSVKVASYANTMSLTTKIDTKDDYKKFDFDTFFNTLEYAAFEDFKKTSSETSFKVYLITNQFKQARINKTIIKSNFLANFFTQLWEGVRV